MRYCVPMDGTASDGLALQQRKRLLMDPTFWKRTMIILILDHKLRFCKRTRWCVKNKGEKKGDQWARFLFIALHCSDENKILHKTKNTFTEIHLTISTAILELKDVTQN